MQRSQYRSSRIFGERVRQVRVESRGQDGRPLSQERLAERSGLHRTYIGHVERGEVNVALSNVVRIAAALNIDPGELVRGIPPDEVLPGRSGTGPGLNRRAQPADQEGGPSANPFRDPGLA